MPLQSKLRFTQPRRFSFHTFRFGVRNSMENKIMIIVGGARKKENLSIFNEKLIQECSFLGVAGTVCADPVFGILTIKNPVKIVIPFCTLPGFANQSVI